MLLPVASYFILQKMEKELDTAEENELRNNEITRRITKLKDKFLLCYTDTHNIPGIACNHVLSLTLYKCVYYTYIIQ